MRRLELCFDNLQCSFGIGRCELVDVNRHNNCSRTCSYSTYESAGNKNDGTLRTGLEEPAESETQGGANEDLFTPEGIHTGGCDDRTEQTPNREDAGGEP